MALLGEDGRGYELARKLETCGVWRTWLGDSTYAGFAPFLTSPSAWDSFITSSTHVPLQLRVRALLFDKATASLSPNPNPNSYLQRLNPTYLQLHADDIYFTLDTPSHDSKNQSNKTVSATGSRYVESELPETWYSQVIDKYKASKNIVSGESRSPAEMASYLKYVTNHKKRRLAFKEDVNSVADHTLQPNGGGLAVVDDGDSAVFPEIAFALNCVPDSALPLSDRVGNSGNQKVKVFSVLDTLPPIAATRSSVMMERLGVRPEPGSMEHGGGVSRGKFGAEGNGKVLGPQQATKLAQKAVARILMGVGFEGAMEGSVDDFSEVLSERICKIGTNLKVLADSYKKQCSAIELLKMLLKTVGFSNFAPLVDVVKDGSKNNVQQSQQQVHGMQAQLQQQQQSSLRLPQQVPMQRQMHPQMQQMLHSQNMAFHQQQQIERMRRRAVATRPSMDIDKERPLVQVKIENQDLPIDGNAFTSRHPQMQFRPQPQQQQQQQMAAMSNFHSQSASQFRQMGSIQIPSMQSPNISMVRAPPVKVEGFSELMGGDSTSKHDLDENRLTSPNGK
ncbi:uncharacterized protein LOC124826719 [Vigna umbellata]|uniref:uncharacterized protein LOC124826719 n=1 Tax=Vigna umbellata TaxID=87088 RepID=UPI001F5E72C5|nr:uncharacterized protein LOC124826718 isoform X1 [Vigna umbellata]XP_047155581.1 uncharacterized protein LOC124826718 isoform X2 [Vigna umbellata]XP_047155582.1 uncharacterized protein LOC124826719 [Vigna umbellata]